MTETREIRIKRLKMRSMRRGIKEMDLILSDYADRELVNMSDAELDLYEVMLEESDLEMFKWVNGQEPAPERFSALISRITQGAHGLTAPRT